MSMKSYQHSTAAPSIGAPIRSTPNVATAAFRFPCGDGIRGFACLLVLVVHSIAIIIPSTVPYLTGCGKIGVWLFFVLSAFLLTNRLIENGGSPAELLSYSVGRVLRIYPLFALAVLVYFCVGTAGIDTRADLVAALTFEKGYVHLWTVPVEFKAYITLPFFAFGLHFLRKYFGFAAIIISAAMLILAHQLVWPYWLLQENSISTLWYLPAFLIGSVAAVVYPSIAKLLSDNMRITIALMIVAGIIMATPAFRAFAFGITPTRDLMNKYLFFSAAWALFIVVMMQGNTWLHQVFQTRFMRSIGAWSYSIYLFHWVVMVKFAQFYPNSIATVVTACVVSVVLGAIVYVMVEHPIETLRAKFRMAFSGSAPASAPA
jgi:peptidoglycan/LPS O-acetylase OafA/YrhL